MKTYLSVVLAVLMTCMTAHAAVNIDRTRLVFNERDKAISLKIENESKKLPYLAYAWVTDSQGQKNDDFFIALPPIQRLEPGAMSQVRIMKQNTARLPQDRESLFYFDLREIPPQPDLQGKNSAVMQLAMQSRIKLFYRPVALQTENIQDQAIKLKVTQNGNWLTINNPTPYHITIAWMGQEGQTLNGFKGDMVAPFDSISVKATGSTRYLLGYLDDYGAMRTLVVSCPSSTCSLSEYKVKKP